MSVCDLPRSRRRRRRRCPRNNLPDISGGLSISHKARKSIFDKVTLFAAFLRGFPCFNTPADIQTRRREASMTSFDQCVAAPPGRFDGIHRPYGPEDVLRLRGSIPIEHTLARRGALKLWELLSQDEPVRALGALSGNQAMQMVRAGLDAIYLSGWQVAADSNVSGSMYPDQSLYPANSGPELARKINRTLQRADQVEHLEGGA